MLYIHPVIQVLATFLALYALGLGLQRFMSLHLGRKTGFQRKRHLLVGKLAIIGWLGGSIGGAVMVRIMWRGWFITGEHAYLAFAMLPFILFGLISGLYLERNPAPRRVLPLLHGCANLTALILALFQFGEGYEVITDFVLGG